MIGNLDVFESPFNNFYMMNITIPRGRMKGDVNGDGIINDEDKSAIQQLYGNTVDSSNENQVAADLDNNGIINSDDRGLLISGQYFTNKKYGMYSEITGTWVSNPNYLTESSQFYYDINVDKISASSDVLLVLNNLFEYIDRCEVSTNNLRIYVKQPPITNISCNILYTTTGNGNIQVTSILDKNSVDTILNSSKVHLERFSIASDYWGGPEPWSYEITSNLIKSSRTFGFLLPYNSEESTMYTAVQDADIYIGNQNTGTLLLYCRNLPTYNVNLLLVTFETDRSDIGGIKSLLPKPYLRTKDFQNYVANNVFIAQYNTTSYNDILDAFYANKIVFCTFSGGDYFPLSYIDTSSSNEIVFSLTYPSTSVTSALVVNSNDRWSFQQKIIVDSNAICDAYSTTSTYNVGDFVMYGGKLYKCKIAITTPENFNSIRWESIKLLDLINT